MQSLLWDPRTAEPAAPASTTHRPQSGIHFSWVPASGISALLVTQGRTEANWYSREPGQKMHLWHLSLIGRTEAWWGRIISDLSEECTGRANHLTSPHPCYFTIWTALQAPGTHDTTFKSMQSTECVYWTCSPRAISQSHKWKEIR